MKKINTSLRVRLFVFLSLLAVTLISGFLLILMLTGVFNQGVKESSKYLQNQMGILNKNVYNDFGKLSRQGIALSQSISSNIDYLMRQDHEKPVDFKKKLSVIIEQETDTVLSAMRFCKCSGAFLILNGTINENLADAQHSKAGVYFRSTEPNIINAIDANIKCLRGPAAVARKRNIELLPQWKQEMNIRSMPFIETVMDNAKDKELPLSRLYYWSDRILIHNNGESGMLLVVPLVSQDGTIYGVCGFEVSAMLFKLAYSPDNSQYPKIFYTLAPLKNKYLSINNGLVAGNYYMINFLTDEDLVIQDSENDINNYDTDEDRSFRGVHRTVALYPKGSVYEKEQMVGGVMMPEEDFDDAVGKQNLKLHLSVFFLFMASLILSFALSRRYVMPIKKAFEEIKTKNYHTEKSKIFEIDDLFQFLAEQDEKKDSAAHSTAMFESFMKNIETLSPAERAVFDLYIEGHTAKEITEILYLSINTIKTHNKRIYEKLNVSSRKELMVYIHMMKELNGEKQEDYD